MTRLQQSCGLASLLAKTRGDSLIWKSLCMGASHSRRAERGGGGRGGGGKQLTLASSFSNSRTTTSAKLHSSRQFSASKWRCFLSMIHLQANTCCTSAIVAGQHLLQVSSCCRSTSDAGRLSLLQVISRCRSAQCPHFSLT